MAKLKFHSVLMQVNKNDDSQCTLVCHYLILFSITYLPLSIQHCTFHLPYLSLLLHFDIFAPSSLTNKPLIGISPFSTHGNASTSTSHLFMYSCPYFPLCQGPFCC